MRRGGDRARRPAEAAPAGGPAAAQQRGEAEAERSDRLRAQRTVSDDLGDGSISGGGEGERGGPRPEVGRVREDVSGAGGVGDGSESVQLRAQGAPGRVWRVGLGGGEAGAGG